jgi:acyl-CoA dehydrogenase
MARLLFEAEHEALRDSVKTFIGREVAPHTAAWEEQGLVDRSAWLAAGAAGLLGIGAPSQLGGGGEPDYRYRMVLMEELSRAGASSLNAGISAQDDLVLPYLTDLGTPAQQAEWTPRLCSGQAIGALAMTEPHAGSDLRAVRSTARREGDGWSLSGSKTFITNGILADVVIVFARTPGSQGKEEFSLFLVPTDSPGFRRGKKLAKLGLKGNDTAELFFDEVRLDDDALLGERGAGFRHLMERLPRERISIAATSLALAQAAIEWTIAYCFEREAFGSRIGDFQNTRFVLAELTTAVEVGEAYLDQAVLRLNAGTLTAVDAAKAKWWLSDLVNRTVDRCVQLHGGYGYMLEYPIAQAYADARIQSIFGGTNEIMKEIIGRDLASSRSPSHL